jgi:crotonobetainyl-CoA:carnitine CoA-transferase CaiB-like acyl-CoA transferase
MLPLQRFRVLDMTQALAGPYCSMILADLGAEVIRIDAPDGGARVMGTRLRGTDGSGFMAVNRNKKSVSIDLKTAEGRARLHRLVGTADVFVENNRVGVADKLGAGWEELSALNDRLVYGSISGFGQTGPYAQRPGYDLIAQGMSGVMSVTGQPGGPPTKAGIPVSDLGAGLFLANGIMAALLAREVTGRGQRVETSLLEAALAMSVWESSELWDSHQVPQSLGGAHRVTAPYQPLSARDRYFNVGANNDKLWRALCHELGLAELLTDERFIDNDARMRNLDTLIPALESVTMNENADVWISRLVKAGVPAGPIWTYAESLSDEHVIERGMVAEVEHPVEGVMKVLGLPVKLSRNPGAIRMAAPLLGEHDAEVFGSMDRQGGGE